MRAVSEVTCPYCHAKVRPERRFSILVFLTLLVLGVTLFSVEVGGGLVLYQALSNVRFEFRRWHVERGMTPQDLIARGLAVKLAADALLAFVVAFLPAFIYVLARLDAYRCPSCGLPL